MKIQPCTSGGRHWFTKHGAVGARVATCRRCGESHPSVEAALQRGLMYARLYTPPEEVNESKQLQRDIALIEDAIERMANNGRH